MKKLKTEFNKNEMRYIQVKRTGTVAMYQLRSIESGACAGYEVWDIPIQQAVIRKMPDGKEVLYEHKERPVGNEEFGIKFRSKSFMREDLFLKYYDLLVNTKPNSPVSPPKNPTV